MDGPVALAAASALREAGGHAPEAPGRHFELLSNQSPLGMVEAINGNIKSLLRRGRGYKNLRYLLLKAQRMAASRTEFVVFRKAA